jgi:DNA-binding MarR family transcriptional regulator
VRAWELLIEAATAVNEERDRVHADLGLTYVQAWVLQFLDPAHPSTMSEVAAAYSCDASNITTMIDKLEARGLVVRSPSESDRRVKMLVVTPAGTQLRRKLLARRRAPPTWIRALSAQDRGELGAILSRALHERADRASPAETDASSE